MKWRSLARSPTLWLGVMVAAFVLISSLAAYATYANFSYVNSNSANNVGAVTQAVASTTYGQHAPFFDSWDCMHVDRCSFLLIHTGFVLYLAVPIYWLAPSAVTLLILQSVIVGLGAVPLYFLTVRLTRSPSKSLVASGLYLAWVPLFSAFTLHLEALLPIEMIGIAALWEYRRYAWAFALAIVSFLTIEVAPIFVMLIGVFFLLEWLPVVIRIVRLRRSVKTSIVPAESPTSSAHVFATIRSRILRSQRFRATVVLIGVSVLAIVILYSFRNVWGYEALAVSKAPMGLGGSGFLSDGSGATAAPIATLLSGAFVTPTAEYWLVMFGLVAFLPLLAPRSLVIILPWVGYTFLTQSLALRSIGLEENTVIAGPMFIGVAYGLARLPWPSGSASPDRPPEPSSPRVSPPRKWGARHPRLARGVRWGAVAVLAATVGVNLLLSPLNPALSDVGLEPGTPFVAGSFGHNLTVTPGLAPAENLVRLIPSNATVAADSRLFPLVANRPNALVFLPGSATEPYGKSTGTRWLPFNLSSGPEYVFLEARELAGLNRSFAVELNDSSIYGLRGYVTSSAVGPLLLYEQGVAGTAQRFGPDFAPFQTTYAPRAGMILGAAGHLISNRSTPGGLAVGVIKDPLEGQKIWYTSPVLLPPGSYTVVLTVRLGATPGSSNATSPAVRLEGTGFGSIVLNSVLNDSSLPLNTWTTLDETIAISNPLPLFQLEAVLLDTSATFSVASVGLQPDGPR